LNKFIYITLFVTLQLPSYGQSEHNTQLFSGNTEVLEIDSKDLKTYSFSYENADEVAHTAALVSFGNLHELSAHLAERCDNEFELVRSIFAWIAGNISYNPQDYSLQLQKAQQVWSNRQAVCEGYSNLFNAMCRSIGIESRMIKGYVRDGQDRPLDFPNHAWNSVLIDGKWYLLDVTWASLSLPDKGTLDLKRKQQLNHFFLVDPHKMILTHLPEDPLWQLHNSFVHLDIFELGEEAIQARLDASSNHDTSDFAKQIAADEALDSLERSIAYLERMVENKRNTAREYGLAIAYYYKARDILEDEEQIDPLSLQKNRQEAVNYFQRSLEYLSCLQENDIGYDFSRDLAKNVTFRMEILQ